MNDLYRRIEEEREENRRLKELEKCGINLSELRLLERRGADSDPLMITGKDILGPYFNKLVYGGKKNE